MHNEEIVGVKREGTGDWKVHTRTGWVNLERGDRLEPDHAYSKKSRLVTENEKRFLPVIQEALSRLSKFHEGTSYNVFPQVALSSFICKDDSTKWRSELFRSVDFLITDQNYEPLLVIEINDRSHDNPERIQRDTNLKSICKEARVPVVFLDGRKEANLISPEDLLQKLVDELQEINSSKITTCLYRVQKPEIKSQLLQGLPQDTPVQSELEVKAKPGSEPISKPASPIASKIGSVRKKKNAKRPKGVSHYYSGEFFNCLLLGLGGYVLGIVFCVVFSLYHSLGGLLHDAVLFIGVPFGWIVVGKFLPESILLRGIIGLLIGSIAYPFMLIYYFIRMILEMAYNHKSREKGIR